MAAYDQIEIIDPQGNIAFERLDPARGTTTIGRSQGNDVPLSDRDGSIGNVHMMIYHRSKPYQVVLYAEEGETRLGNEVLRPNERRPLRDGDTIALNGHVLVFLEGNSTTGANALAGGGGYTFSEATATEMAPAVTAMAAGAAPTALASTATEQPDPQQTPAAMQMSDPVQAASTGGLAQAVLRNREVVVLAGQRAVFSILLTNTHKTERQTLYVKAKYDDRTNGVAEQSAWPGGFKINGMPPVTAAARESHSADDAVATVTLGPGESKTAEVWMTTLREGEHYFVLTVFSQQTAQLPYIEMALPACLRVYRGDMHDRHQPANIEIEMAERDKTVEPGLPTPLTLLIYNHGPKEASFSVQYEWAAAGKRPQPRWPVQVSMPIDAHAGESKIVPIVLDTDADTDVSAGVYPIRFVVMSGAYAGSQCSLVARIRVEAVERFEVSGLARYMVRLGRKPRASNVEQAFKYTIENQGNRNASFVINGQDRAGECDFYWREGSKLAPLPQQVAIPDADHTLRYRSIEIVAQPRNRVRRAVAANATLMDVTFTTSLISEPPQAPKPLIGQLVVPPKLYRRELIGLILVMALIFMGFLVWLLAPRGSLELHQRQTKTLNSGKPIPGTSVTTTAYLNDVEIRWKDASPVFPAISVWKLSPRGIDLSGDSDVGITVTEPITTVFRMEPNNFVTRWMNDRRSQFPLSLFIGPPATQVVTVVVLSLTPSVTLSAPSEVVNFGESGTVTWTVPQNTNGMVLSVNGLRLPLPQDVITSTKFNIPFEQLTQPDNHIQLIAQNEFFPDGRPSKEITISVKPRINLFTASPTTFVNGREPSKVVLRWSVESRGTVTITRIFSNTPTTIGKELGPQGELEDVPTGEGLNIYRLEAGQNISKPVEVQVFRESKFQIVTFKFDSLEVVIGSPKTLTVTWEIFLSNYYKDKSQLSLTGPLIGTLQIQISATISSSIGSTLTIPGAAGTYQLRLQSGQEPPQVKDLIVTGVLPTPTPPPPAFINFFIAVDVNGIPIPDKAILEPQTEIILRWQASNAIKTTLQIGGSAAGDQPVQESNFKFKVSRNNRRFVLQAFGAAGPGEVKSLEFDIKSIAAPPAPSLRIDESKTPFLLTWTHPDPSALTKFTIRRAPVPDGLYITIPYTATPANNNNFEDTVPPVQRCGYSYYVESYFLNDDGKEQLGNSSNIWTIPLCPTPTPQVAPTEEAAQIQIVPLILPTPTPTPIP